MISTAALFAETSAHVDFSRPLSQKKPHRGRETVVEPPAAQPTGRSSRSPGGADRPYSVDLVCVAVATHRQPDGDGGSACGLQVTRNGHDG